MIIKSARSLLLIVIVFSLQFSGVFSAESSFASSDGLSQIPLNYSRLYIGSVGIYADTVVLSDISPSEEYRYIMLALDDSAGNEPYNEVAERTADGMAVFKIENLKSGSYEFRVFHSSEMYSLYNADIYDVVTLDWNGSGGTFRPSPAYEINYEKSKGENAGSSAEEFFLKPSRGIESDDPQIISLANSITAGYTDKYSKALAIHDWVCTNLYYDIDILKGRSDNVDDALVVLNSKKGVCAGYSVLTAALCRAAGIPAKTVSGFATGIYTSGGMPDADTLRNTDSNHEWNELLIDGRWVIVDTTWDCDNAVENGSITKSGGCRSHRYFDISPEFFAYDHCIESIADYGELMLFINYPQYYSDGTWKDIDSGGTSPLIVNGRTLVPIRAIVEEMGGTVEWNQSERKISCLLNCENKNGNYYVNSNGHLVQMWLDYGTYFDNNSEYYFDIPPQIINNRTFVPLRSVLESMGCTVEWSTDPNVWAQGFITIGYAA